MEQRVVGNRRSEEELEQIKISMNKTSFVLMEQPNFIGTAEQLENMQNIEREYIDGGCPLSDEEWEIIKRKHNYVESPMSISPSGRSWIKLYSPLPSIDKCGDMSGLKAFLNKFKDGQEFRIQCKLDGLPGNFRYKKEKSDDGKIVFRLSNVSSKGNGRYGLELNTYALSGIRMNVPTVIDELYVKEVLNLEDGQESPDYYEQRGEAVMKKNKFNFEKYGKDPVWRSVAAGIFNRKVPANFDGLFQYLYQLTFDEFMKVHEEMTGENDFINIDNIAEARLFASLDENSGRFLRGDKLTIFGDRKILVEHKDGSKYAFYDKGEEVDVVFYSTSIEDSNIDTEKIGSIPGVKYIDKVDFQEDLKDELKDYSLTYRITSDKNEIIKAVADFYGTDLDGNRDMSKPRLRNMYEYAIDGVVIKPVDSNRETQGMYFRNHKNNPNKIVTPKYPEDQIAVKLLSEITRVKLEKIVKSETTLGNVTCSGVLDKPYRTESGTIVKMINLHNPEWIELNSWIKEGEEYDMIMSCDIIPVLLNPNL